MLIGASSTLSQAALAQDSARALSLGDAARLAAQRNAGATIAHYRADEVRARVVQRRADLLPSVSAMYSDGQRTFNTASFGIPFPGFDPNGTIIGPVRTVDLRARVAMNLFDPAARARYHGAQSSADSAQAGEAAASEQAAVAAAGAYIRVMRADAQIVARAADSSSAAQLLGIAREQLAAGVGVALDVTRAQSQLAAIRSQLIAARNEAGQSRLALQRSLGFASAAPIVLRDSLPITDAESVFPDPAQAVALALRTRPELRAATAAIESAQRARDAARAGRLPSVGVFADEGATSSQYNHLLQTYSYGLQLSVPVFEGRRTEGRIEEQSAVVREAEVRLADLRQQIEYEVQSALLDIASATEQVASAESRLRFASDETEQARERFTAGVAGNADVVSALLALTGSRTQLVDAQTALRTAWVSLAKAQGRLRELP
jgi:outer membrane protein